VRARTPDAATPDDREPSAARRAGLATTIRQAANLLRGRTIGCLPVMEDSKLVGIVTVTDLLELVGEVIRKASTDARWKPTRRMGRWPRTGGARR
jgi:CBS-domain-containing membrane protein